MKIPFGLYNDTSDIDAARVPVLLPQSVYPLTSRFLLAQTGAEIYGYADLRRAGALEYRIYGGTLFIDLPNQAGAPIPITKIAVPYVFGGRLLWETPIEGLRFGGSIQPLRLDLNLLLPASAMAPATPVTYGISAVLSVVSIEYAAHDLLLAVEYGRWRIKRRKQRSDAVSCPRPPVVWQERGYAMAAYRLKTRLQVGLYYSVLFPDVDKLNLWDATIASKSHGRADLQLDGAASLRFDINPHWLVKVEGHYMHGTAGLDPALNGNTPRPAMTEDWGVFLVKTTAYF